MSLVEPRVEPRRKPGDDIDFSISEDHEKMSDLVNTARSARESLAQALAALQSPGVPPELLDVAEPIASAMGALHEIEASRGGANGHAAPRALAEVRRALSALQADVTGHRAIEQATEAVAGSLGLVHALSAGAPAPAEVPQAAPAAASPVAAPPAQKAPEPQRRDGSHSEPLLRVDAPLGVHSPTNFYKGLSGNDVIESGGLFIATYQSPKIGQKLLVHVTLPGGYEFDAKGIVRWTREPAASSSFPAEAPPGYGVRFTEISPEARLLVERYVKNREPLFHDDL